MQYCRNRKYKKSAYIYELVAIIKRHSNMTIADYIQETEYAASRLIDDIWHEYNQQKTLEDEIKKLQTVVQHQYRQAQSLMDSDDPDDVMLGAGVHWQTYFEEDKQLFHKSEAYQKLEQQIQTHTYSIQTLCSGLLQIAKQGISIVHNGIDTCPNGRTVGTQNLKDVVWQARNQTMHYEEGNCRPPIVAVFAKLSSEFDPVFNNYNLQNLAFEVIKVLDWTDYNKYKADIQSLA